MTMTNRVGTVAVVAHTGKQLDGGPHELRQALRAFGIRDPLWYDVTKSKQAPKRAREARDQGADLLIAFGGDGLAQRCIDALAGGDTALALIPAGTANLLATNLGVPKTLEGAVEVALHGNRRAIDTGTMNGEHFAVMAGAGFDARMIKRASGDVKRRFGRLAYLWTGARELTRSGVTMRIKIDGNKWFKGPASCVLVGNVGDLFGRVTAFPDAEPDDGVLNLGVVTAHNVWQWTRALTRTAFGTSERSPFVQVTQGRSFDIKMSKPVPYELDGGDRAPTKHLRIEIVPSAIRIAVPEQ
jgi:YegS/Rv2252/BmrU family lipid kinase